MFDIITIWEIWTALLACPFGPSSWKWVLHPRNIYVWQNIYLFELQIFSEAVLTSVNIKWCFHIWNVTVPSSVSHTCHRVFPCTNPDTLTVSSTVLLNYIFNNRFVCFHWIIANIPKHLCNIVNIKVFF